MVLSEAKSVAAPTSKKNTVSIFIKTPIICLLRRNGFRICDTLNKLALSWVKKLEMDKEMQ
jgi:hypothetical protein